MKPEDIYFLVGCEESQAITIELRKLGVNAFSNDLKPCSGGHPEWHIQGDVFDAINPNRIRTNVLMSKIKMQDGSSVFINEWHAAIFHPTCTFLSSSGVQWLSHPEDKNLPFDERRPNPKYPNRKEDMLDSVDFVERLWNCGIPFIRIENPIGLLSSRFMKPSQIIQPYQFGDEASKSTCLWNKGFPNIIPTKTVGKGEKVVFKSGKSHPKWYADAMKNAKSADERREIRSKTFSGMAGAIAKQSVEFLINALPAKG